MGRAGRGGGGMRGGGGRMGGSRGGSGRIGGVGNTGRAGQGTGGIGRAPAAPRVSAPRPVPRRGGGFGAGLGMGLGAGMLMGRRRRRMFWGGGWGRRRMMGGPGMGGGGGGCGCFSVIAAAIVLVLVISVVSWIFNFSMPFVGGGGMRTITVAPSTIRREALPANAATGTGPMFTDNLGWMRNQNVLLPGLRDFHSRTGVRPHLYLTDELDGRTELPNLQQISEFANRRYGELFQDEAHVLLVFFENAQGQRAMYVVAGSQAQLVMDDEARNILMDFVDRYYYADMNEDEMFNRAFNGAGRRIMTVTRSQWVPVLVVAGVLLIVVLLFIWWKRRQEQKNLEAEQTESILNQPLDTFGSGDDEAERLAKQYEEDNKK